MANYIASDTDLTAVANAIRTKGGTAAALAFPSGFVSAVQAIPSGGGGALPTGMTHIGSGSFTFATNALLTEHINHGLDFTPKAVIVWTEYETDYGFVYGFLTKELVYNALTAKGTRTIVVRTNSSNGYELLGGTSTTDNEYITDTYFTFNHGSRRFIAGATYNWFAFD